MRMKINLMRIKMQLSYENGNERVTNPLIKLCEINLKHERKWYHDDATMMQARMWCRCKMNANDAPNLQNLMQEYLQKLQDDLENL